MSLGEAENKWPECPSLGGIGQGWRCSNEDLLVGKKAVQEGRSWRGCTDNRKGSPGIQSTGFRGQSLGHQGRKNSQMTTGAVFG